MGVNSVCALAAAQGYCRDFGGWALPGARENGSYWRAGWLLVEGVGRGGMARGVLLCCGGWRGESLFLELSSWRGTVAGKALCVDGLSQGPGVELSSEL